MVDNRNPQELYNALESADMILLKKYLGKLDQLPIIDIPESISNIKTGSNVVLYHVDKLVYDNKENVHDKLTTVFSSLLSDKNNGLVMLIRGAKDHVDFYIGNTNRNINSYGAVPVKSLENTGRTLSSVLKGNFPGTK